MQAAEVCKAKKDGFQNVSIPLDSFCPLLFEKVEFMAFVFLKSFFYISQEL